MIGSASNAAKRNILPSLVGLTTLLLGVGSVYLFALSTSQPSPEIRSLPEVAVKWPIPPQHVTGTAQIEEKKSSEPTITQSKIVNFPRIGTVRVEAIEQIGKFPEMVFKDVKSGKVVFRSSITDSDGWLKPTDDEEFTQPFLRFRVVRSPGFSSPLIMAVAVRPGGSDHLFLSVVFGEVNGKITRLNTNPIETNIQGGYYLGYLNRKLGYGLVSWCFDWESSEIHYDYHHYYIDIYTISNGRFRKTFSSRSKRKYGPVDSYRALNEFGIKGKDVRRTMPDMKEFVEADL